MADESELIARLNRAIAEVEDALLYHKEMRSQQEEVTKLLSYAGQRVEKAYVGKAEAIADYVKHVLGKSETEQGH